MSHTKRERFWQDDSTHFTSGRVPDNSCKESPHGRHEFEVGELYSQGSRKIRCKHCGWCVP